MYEFEWDITNLKKMKNKISKAKPNKYAKDFNQSTIKIYDDGKLIKEMKPVLVEIDILQHFKTAQRINDALRSLIHA